MGLLAHLPRPPRPRLGRGAATTTIRPSCRRAPLRPPGVTRVPQGEWMVRRFWRHRKHVGLLWRREYRPPRRPCPREWFSASTGRATRAREASSRSPAVQPPPYPCGARTTCGVTPATGVGAYIHGAAKTLRESVRHEPTFRHAKAAPRAQPLSGRTRTDPRHRSGDSGLLGCRVAALTSVLFFSWV